VPQCGLVNSTKEWEVVLLFNAPALLRQKTSHSMGFFLKRFKIMILIIIFKKKNSGKISNNV